MPAANVLALRHRETATEAMIRQIDDKIARLDAARTQRFNALQNIRYELIRAQQAGKSHPDAHAA